MKKAILFLLILMMASCFCGCVDKENNNLNNTNEQEYYNSFSKSEIGTTDNLPQGAIVFDIFKDFEQYFVFSGYNGAGTVEIRIPDKTTIQFENYYFCVNLSDYSRMYYGAATGFEIIKDNEDYGKIDFCFSSNSKVELNGLSKGDTFTVECRLNSITEEKFQLNNFYFKSKSATFTAPDFGDLIKSFDELSDADIAQIQDYVLTQNKLSNSSNHPEDIRIRATTLYKVKSPAIVVDKDKLLIIQIELEGRYAMNRIRIDVWCIAKTDDGQIKFSTKGCNVDESDYEVVER